jgi:hypothetical protein
MSTEQQAPTPPNAQFDALLKEFRGVAIRHPITFDQAQVLRHDMQSILNEMWTLQGLSAAQENARTRLAVVVVEATVKSAQVLASHLAAGLAKL